MRPRPPPLLACPVWANPGTPGVPASSNRAAILKPRAQVRMMSVVTLAPPSQGGKGAHGSPSHFQGATEGRSRAWGSSTTNLPSPRHHHVMSHAGTGVVMGLWGRAGPQPEPSTGPTGGRPGREPAGGLRRVASKCCSTGSPQGTGAFALLPLTRSAAPPQALSPPLGGAHPEAGVQVTVPPFPERMRAL